MTSVRLPVTQRLVQIVFTHRKHAERQPLLPPPSYILDFPCFWPRGLFPCTQVATRGPSGCPLRREPTRPRPLRTNTSYPPRPAFSGVGHQPLEKEMSTSSSHICFPVRSRALGNTFVFPGVSRGGGSRCRGRRRAPLGPPVPSDPQTRPAAPPCPSLSV